MNCKTSQIEIEERGAQNLSAAALKHLNDCAECSGFNQETERLRQLLQNLETVSAPADFNFRVKSRVRRAQNTSVNPGWRKLIWIAPPTLAAVLCGFILVKNSSDTDHLQAEANIAATQVAALTTPPPAAKTIEDKTNEPNLTAERQTIKPAAPILIARNNEPKMPANRRTEKNSAAARAKRKTTDENEIVKSGMASLRQEGVAILPPGIPNPLAAPPKLDAKQLLLTMGIKTENAENGLRVVSISTQDAAKFGLQTNDLIEKVNNENPSSVTGNSFQELNLTVRRQQVVQQIKISAKP